MNILIIGATGKIGKLLKFHLDREGFSTYATTRCEDSITDRMFFDLKTLSGLQNLDFSKFDLTIHLAAMTSIQECDQQADLCYKMNVEHTIALAEKAITSGSFFVFPSTDLLTTDVAPEEKACSVLPLYAQHKLAVEKWLLRSYKSRCVILRIGKLLDPNFQLFKDWTLSLRKNQKIQAYADHLLSPLLPDELIEIVHRTIVSKTTGIIDCPEKLAVDYFFAANAIAAALKVDNSLVEPIFKNKIIQKPHMLLDDSQAAAARRKICNWVQKYGTP